MSRTIFTVTVCLLLLAPAAVLSLEGETAADPQAVEQTAENTLPEQPLGLM